MTQTPIEIEVVTDFSPGISLGTRAGKFDERYFHIAEGFNPALHLPKTTPVGGTLSQVVNLRGKVSIEGWIKIKGQEWIEALNDLDPKEEFVHLFTFMEILKYDPDLQRKVGMLTIWADPAGQWWCAMAHTFRTGDRSFGIYPLELGLAEGFSDQFQAVTTQTL